VRRARSIACSLVVLGLALPGHAVRASTAAGAGAPDSWSEFASLPTPRRLLAAAADGGKIYTFGGCGSPCFEPPLHTDTFEETRVEVYDLATGVWSARPPIPAILFGAAAAAPGNGRIYIFGGYLTGSLVLEYDPVTSAWATKSPMPTPRYGLAAVALDGKVYALGGSGPSAALEVYDPASDRWIQRAPMPTARVFLAAAALGGKIYALGGSPDAAGASRSAALEVYDPATDAWSEGAPLPVAEQLSAAVALNGKIYAFGGFIPGAGVRNTSYEYDPAADAWTARAQMPAARDQAPAVVAADGLAYVLGGSTDCHCRAIGIAESYTPPGAHLADLAITLTGTDPVSTCQPVRYGIAVTNNGPDAANGALVRDRFPSALREITWTCSAFAGARCTPASGGFTGQVADRVDLPAGGSVTYEVSAKLDAAATGIVTDTATVAPPDGFIDPVPGNNRSTVSATIASCQPGLTKSITATSEASTGPSPQGEQLAIGEIVRYRLQIDVPDGVLPGLTLQDTLPSGLVWLPSTCAVVAKSPAIITSVKTPKPMISMGGQNLTVAFGDVKNTSASDATPELLAVECDALVLNRIGPTAVNQQGDLKPNSFTVQLQPPAGPPVTFTSNAVQAVVVEPAGGLVKKELVAIPGADATYQLSYTNTGTASAFDVLIEDQLPASLTIAVGTLTGSGCTVRPPGPLSPGDVVVTCPVVPPGGTVSVTFSVTGLPRCGQFTNVATLTYSSLPGPNGTVPNPTGAVTPGAPGAPRGKRVYPSGASVVTTGRHCPDLTLVKGRLVLDGGHFGFGTYFVSVFNVGEAVSVPPDTVTDTLPSGMFFVDGGGNGWTCAASGSTVTCTSSTPIPPVPGSGSFFSIRVQLPTSGPFDSNCAQVSTTAEIELDNNRGCECIEPPAGMIAWFAFDEPAGLLPGNLAFDFVSHLPIGQYMPPGGPKPSAGEDLLALCFEGAGSFVDVPMKPPTPVSVDLGMGDLTIDTWVKTSAGSGVETILDKRQSLPDLRGYSLFLFDGRLGFQMADGPGFTNWVASTGNVADGHWHHVAVTVQRERSSGGAFYVDCNLVDTFDPTERSGNLDNSADLWIAGTHDLLHGKGPTSTFSGCLDELEVFNRALSAAEIKAFCTAGSSGKCKFFPH
jgi:uncharacterized repeat protein (TIGR01451 family)